MQLAINPIQLVFRNFLLTQSDLPSQPGKRNSIPVQLHLFAQMINAHPVLDHITPSRPEAYWECCWCAGIFCRGGTKNRPAEVIHVEMMNSLNIAPLDMSPGGPNERLQYPGQRRVALARKA